MSVQVTIDLPKESLSILRITPENFAREMLLVATVKWYEIGRISQSKAAELLQISRAEFFDVLSRFGVSPFQTPPEELVKEIKDV